MYRRYLNSWWAQHYDIGSILFPGGKRLVNGRIVDDYENLIIKWMEYLEKEGLTELPMPDGLRIPDHQVNGHIFGKSKTLLGLLQCPEDGTILKPCQPMPRGIKELEFYEQVFNPKETDEIVIELRNYIPKYHGTWTTDLHPEVTYIKLQDITYKMKRPSVLDSKIGCVTYDPEARPEKREREIAKYPHAQEVGFRFSGMRVFSIDRMEYIVPLKEVLRSFSAREILTHGFPIYFEPCAQFKADFITSFIRKLLRINAWFSKQKKFTFYASSILLVYDASRMLGREKPCVRCRKIFDKMAENNYHAINECRQSVTIAGKRELMRTALRGQEDEDEDPYKPIRGPEFQQTLSEIKKSHDLVIDYMVEVKKTREGIVKTNKKFKNAMASFRDVLNVFNTSIGKLKPGECSDSLRKIHDEIKENVDRIQKDNEEKEACCDGVDENREAFLANDIEFQKNMNELHKILNADASDLFDIEELQNALKILDRNCKEEALMDEKHAAAKRLLTASEDTKDKIKTTLTAVAESNAAALELLNMSEVARETLEKSLDMVEETNTLTGNILCKTVPQQADAIEEEEEKRKGYVLQITPTGEEGNAQPYSKEQSFAKEPSFARDQSFPYDQSFGNDPSYGAYEEGENDGTVFGGANKNYGETNDYEANDDMPFESAYGDGEIESNEEQLVKSISYGESPEPGDRISQTDNDNDNNCNKPGMYSYGGPRDFYSVVANDQYLMDLFMEECPYCDHLTDVKMIDFVHVFPTEIVDENYVFGLCSFISYLLNLLVLYNGMDSNEKVNVEKLKEMNKEPEEKTEEPTESEKSMGIKLIPSETRLIKSDQGDAGSKDPDALSKDGKLPYNFVRSDSAAFDAKDRDPARKISNIKSNPDQLDPLVSDPGYQNITDSQQSQEIMTTRLGGADDNENLEEESDVGF